MVTWYLNPSYPCISGRGIIIANRFGVITLERNFHHCYHLLTILSAFVWSLHQAHVQTGNRAASTHVVRKQLGLHTPRNFRADTRSRLIDLELTSPMGAIKSARQIKTHSVRLQAKFEGERWTWKQKGTCITIPMKRKHREENTNIECDIRGS